jgi:hypothetical protein
MSEIRPLQLDPKLLPDTTRLWRYVPLRTLFLYLSGKVFVPSIETLRKGDPFEAEFYYDDHPATFNGALEEWYGDADAVLKWLFDSRLEEWQRRIVRPDPAGLINYNQSFFPKAYFEFIRSTRYAWCWFAPEADLEEAAMWNTYGKDGAAVITTIGNLRKALGETDRDFEFGRMFYVHADDYGRVSNVDEVSPSDDSARVLRPHFLKRAEYVSEHEVRFVAADCEREAGGISIELNPQEWIEEIRLWPGLSLSETTALQEIITSKLPNTPCERSGMLKNAHNERIAALWSDCFQWSGDASDSIPSGLKRLWPIQPTPPATEPPLASS